MKPSLPATTHAGAAGAQAGLARYLIPLLLFLAVFAGHILPGVKGSPDSTWSIHLALSLIREGDLDLDEYEPIVPMNDHRTELVGGHRYSYFPVGAPLVAAPFVAVLDRLSGPLLGIDDLYAYIQQPRTTDLTWRLEHWIASLLVALAAAVMYALARLRLDAGRALLVALVFAFATPAWSTASRGLWSHGPAMLALALALYLLLRARERPHLAGVAGLPLALAFVIRSNNSISAALLAVYVFIEHRRYFPAFCAWALPVALPFLAYSLSVYGAPLPPYYLPGRVGSHPGLVEALLGNLASPSRGLFVYSPVLLLAFYGVLLKVRQGEFRKLDLWLLAAVFLHWLAISSFPHWWGGASYGPRLFADVTPYLVYFLIPVAGAFGRPAGLRAAAGLAGAAALAAASVFIHYRGAADQATFEWNNFPLRVDEHPERLWDWGDAQFLRGLAPARQPITAAPAAVHLAARPGEEARLALALRNTGDQPYVWQASAPTRVLFDQSIGTLTYPISLTARVATAGLAPGVHNVGGLHVQAAAENGRPVKNGSLVVPITLQVIETGASSPAAAPGAFVAPPDLFVDGAPVALGPDRPAALHGQGWYDAEAQGDFVWRWAMSPAELLVYSPAAGRARLASTLVALHQPGAPGGLGEAGALRVSVNGGPAERLAVRVETPFSADLALEAGWNRVRLALEAGNFRPAGVDPASADTRPLSFALGRVDLAAE
jgi:hypothetical protein